MDFVVMDEADWLVSGFRHPMEMLWPKIKDRSEFEPRLRADTPRTQYILAGATMPGTDGEAEDNPRMIVQSKWPDATWVKSRDLHRPLAGLKHRFIKVPAPLVQSCTAPLCLCAKLDNERHTPLHLLASF